MPRLHPLGHRVWWRRARRALFVRAWFACGFDVEDLVNLAALMERRGLSQYDARKKLRDDYIHEHDAILEVKTNVRSE